MAPSSQNSTSELEFSERFSESTSVYDDPLLDARTLNAKLEKDRGVVRVSNHNDPNNNLKDGPKKRDPHQLPSIDEDVELKLRKFFMSSSSDHNNNNNNNSNNSISFLEERVSEEGSLKAARLRMKKKLC